MPMLSLPRAVSRNGTWDQVHSIIRGPWALSTLTDYRRGHLDKAVFSGSTMSVTALDLSSEILEVQKGFFHKSEMFRMLREREKSSRTRPVWFMSHIHFGSHALGAPFSRCIVYLDVTFSCD